MLKEIIATALLTGSIGSKSLEPIRADISPNESYTGGLISGAYNFKDVINYADMEQTLAFLDHESDVRMSWRFDKIPQEGGMPDYTFAVPCSYNDELWYVETLSIHEYYGDEISVIFTLLATGLDNPTTFSFGTGTDTFEIAASTSTLQTFIFYINTDLFLDKYQKVVWDCLFTTDDNAFTTTYNGFYTFSVNRDEMPSSLTYVGFGSVIFNNALYIGFGVRHYGTDNYNFINTRVTAHGNFGTDLVGFSLPLTSINVSGNAMLSNLKMSYISKQHLQSMGVFAYVRDTSYDNATFKDLFFGIADTPIYFATSLFSFEFLGINLFAALTGLLTLIVVITLIKKFW